MHTLCGKQNRGKTQCSSGFSVPSGYIFLTTLLRRWRHKWACRRLNPSKNLNTRRIPWLPPEKEHGTKSKVTGRPNLKPERERREWKRKIDLDAFQFTPEETRGGNIFFFESRERIPGNGLMWYHLLLFFLLRHRRLGAIGRDSTKVLKWNLNSPKTHHVHSPTKKNNFKFKILFSEFMGSPTSEHFEKDKCAALTEGTESWCPATKKSKRESKVRCNKLIYNRDSMTNLTNSLQSEAWNSK